MIHNDNEEQQSEWQWRRTWDEFHGRCMRSGVALIAIALRQNIQSFLLYGILQTPSNASPLSSKRPIFLMMWGRGSSRISIGSRWGIVLLYWLWMLKLLEICEIHNNMKWCITNSSPLAATVRNRQCCSVISNSSLIFHGQRQPKMTSILRRSLSC